MAEDCSLMYLLAANFMNAPIPLKMYMLVSNFTDVPAVQEYTFLNLLLLVCILFLTCP